MAKKLGLQRSHYSEFVNGKRNLPVAALRKAFELGVPANVLLQTPKTRAAYYREQCRLLADDRAMQGGQGMTSNKRRATHVNAMDIKSQSNSDLCLLLNVIIDELQSRVAPQKKLSMKALLLTPNIGKVTANEIALTLAEFGIEVDGFERPCPPLADEDEDEPQP